MFTKLLIANRGEIAVRIIRACRELGVRTVAVYSEADANSRHVKLADEAVAIGAAPPNESYLCSERIIHAAQRSGAEAIHPGYGFLSESADFAQAVMDAGLVFIGPTPQAMRVMGDKSHARAMIQASGVPIVPGYQGDDNNASMQRAADDLGYPLLIKAAHGGGGRGMRRVLSPAELPDALAAARREARNAFGNERLVLEKYIANARHIEFQVFGDRHGNVVHLFERECSIQRRYQKIIEETPSLLLDSTLREAMSAAAVAAARSVGYENAGTVEFIVDPDQRAFYFLEMNTRLQVEHPITEMTTGLDIVEWQLRVSAGEPLPLTQDRIARRGHAIECRVCAEEPAHQFLPSTGKLLRVSEPQGPGLRIDSGFVTGDEVTIHYDPLLAKVIAFAESREGAIRKMQAALRDYVVLGVTTNLAFLQAVLAHEEVREGRATTTFLEQYLADWTANEQVIPDVALIAAALAEWDSAAAAPASSVGQEDPFNPWRAISGFPNGRRAMKFLFDCRDRHFTIDLEKTKTGYRVSVDGQPHDLQVTPSMPGEIIMRVDGRAHRAWVAKDGLRRWVFVDGQTYSLRVSSSETRRREGTGAGPGASDEIRSPMPGQVWAVQASEGDLVEKGQTVLVLEAMKIELRIAAPRRGRLARLLVHTGQTVEREQLLGQMTSE